jgi:hypothetical protein
VRRLLTAPDVAEFLQVKVSWAYAEARHDSILLAGDYGFRTQINKSHQLGLITSRERLERIRAHILFVRTRLVASEQFIRDDLEELLAERILIEPEGHGQ